MRQSEVAEEQRGIAVEQATEAEKQRRLAETRREEAERTQSLFLADLSLQQTAYGNATNGILLALEALPDDMGRPDRPYVFQAETALYGAIFSHRELAILRGHEGSVQHAAFSPDGSRIVTASSDNTARLWDAAGGVEIAVLRGHEDPVRHAAFSPDGSRIVTASWDYTARLWDATSGKEIAVLGGHEASVSHAAFSPDGGRVVTASDDGTARIFRVFLTTQALIDHARKTVPRQLTPAQRKQFFLDVE